MELIKDIMQKIGDFINGIVNTGLESTMVGWIACGIVLALLLIIIIIICVCASKAKKKKANKKKEVKDESTNNEEPVIEVKEEEEKVEEHNNEEVVEDVQEEIEEPTEVEAKDSIEEVVEDTNVQVENTAQDESNEDVQLEDNQIQDEAPSQIEDSEEATIIVDDSSKQELIDEGIIKEEPKKENEVAPKEVVKKEKKAPSKKAAPKKVKEEPAPVKEVKQAQGKYVLVQEGPNWRYNLKASNGEVIIVSEPYSSEKAVRGGIETLKKNVETSRCEIVEDKHGLFSFMVITKQGRCLATSANYKARARAVSASESYKRWAASETIIIDDNQDKNHMEVEVVNVEIEEANNGIYNIKESEHGFIYQLLAANRRIVATSQSYKTKASCLEALEKFRVYVYEGTFYVYKDKNDKFQFKLYNKQNRLVLAGEVYDDKARVISVIEAIKRLAKQAKVVE